MSDNVAITPGSGNTIAADEVVDGTLGTVKVQYVKLMDGTLDGTSKASVGVNGLKVDGSAVTQPVSISVMPSTPVTGIFFQAVQPTYLLAANLSVSTTGAAAAPVTATLPAVAGQFHYILGIEIEAYSTAARTGGTTPILVTSTNLPGNNVWTFASAAAIGATDTKWYQTAGAIKSSTVNTATTIVCPATTGIIWRVNVYYYTGI